MSDSDQLKQGISDIANNTEFNKKKLLDGSYSDGFIATGANGSGVTLDIGNATLQALGIEDFDVTGDFSVQTIDKALGMVSSDRSTIGAQSNSLEYSVSYNSEAAINLNAAASRLKDTDLAETATEMSKKKLLQTYQLLMQKKQQDQERQKFSLFF